MRESDRRMYEAWATLSAYRRRVAQAKEVMLRGADRGTMALAVSWGKDSLAMAHLALEVAPGATLFHLASPYELPGYEESVAYFSSRMTVHNAEAPRTLADYIEWCRDVGLPHERTRAAQHRAVKEIKKDRGSEWIHEHGFTVMALGMRIDEKGPRAAMLRARGPVYSLVDGTHRCCPIAYWTGRDVWAYIVTNGIPYNRRLYDAETHGMTRETIRNTGWLSTDGAGEGRIAWLREHFRDQYETLVKEFPHVALLT